MAPAAWHNPRLSYLPRGHSGGGKFPLLRRPRREARKARGAAARGPGRGASGGKEGAGPPGSTPRVPLTLGDGDGLEAMQLLEQAAWKGNAGAARIPCLHCFGTFMKREYVS